MASDGPIDFGPAEAAARMVGEGRVRQALVVLGSLGGTGVLVEDAVIDGDASVLAQTVALLEDPETRVAEAAAYLLGERSYRSGSASEVEGPLHDALTRAMITAPDRAEALAAALRECARVGGAKRSAPELIELARRNMGPQGGSLAFMWSVEALLELGWSVTRIEGELGPMADEVLEYVRTELLDIARGLADVRGGGQGDGGVSEST